MMRLAGFALETDPWLGGLLGRPAYRVAAAAGSCASLPESPFFATAKIAAQDVSDAGRLEDSGFRIVDTALTFAAPADIIRDNDAAGVREARSADRGAVAEIARTAFQFSRFHLDSRLPKSLAGRIKAAWAENYFSGRHGDAMIVATFENRVCGFLQLLRASGDRLIIDLIAVDPRCRGRGLARGMIGHAVSVMRPAELVVGTQAANLRSVRLYENLGFRLSAAQLVLHCHGGQEEYRA
jgi:ribosomal protein S18 acetylase RimI-like enzyme